jgi:hypothetical protein
MGAMKIGISNYEFRIMKYLNTCIFGDTRCSTSILDIQHSIFIILFSVSFIVQTKPIRSILSYSGTYAGTAEPFQVAPPEAAVYPNANYD